LHHGCLASAQNNHHNYKAMHVILQPLIVLLHDLPKPPGPICKCQMVIPVCWITNVGCRH
jgi:hypothetical protein